MRNFIVQPSEMIMKRLSCLILAFIIVAACKEKYVLPVTTPPTGYLVVEGYINSGAGPTTIRLSRSARLDSSRYPVELKAQVAVEGQNSTRFLLTEKGKGIYSVDQLSLIPSQKYRLYIKTLNGKEYTTDYLPVRNTPPVDSLNWEENDAGVEIFVNTHDPQNNSRFYAWDFEETWQYYSIFHSLLQFTYFANGEISGVTDRPASETEKLYTCWKTLSSTKILAGTSNGLTRDSIHVPIHQVDRPDVKISVMYSILVRQHSISFEEYDFLQKMKKNTEQVGSIFDAQPSEITGNIHAAGNSKEIVIGFIGIANSTEKRIFIQRNQLKKWPYFDNCYEFNIKNNPDSLAPYSLTMPTSAAEYSQSGAVIRVYLANPDCVDCRLRGGVNTKPSFWP
jgi:hypothetical protein